MISRSSVKLDNATKMAVVMFFSNLYFYSHIGTLYLQTRGLNLLQINSLWSIILAGILVAELPTGVLADRIGREWSVVVALFLQAMGEFFFLFAGSYLAFVLIAVLAGVGFAFLSGASEALIYDSLPIQNRETRMKKAMGLVGGLYQLAFFVAPLLGGIIVSELVLSRFLLAIFLTACSVSAAFFISLTLEEPQEAYSHPEEGPLAVFRDGMGQLGKHRRLQWIVAVAMLTSAFPNALVTLYQPHFVKASVSAFWIGASLSLGGLLAFVVQKHVYLVEQALERYGLLLMTIWPAVMYILLAVASYPPALLPIFVVAYASVGAKSPLLSSYQNRLIQSKSRATVLSLMNMFAKLYAALMGLALGRLADISIPLTFSLIGMVVILSAFILRVDRLAIAFSKVEQR